MSSSVLAARVLASRAVAAYTRPLPRVAARAFSAGHQAAANHTSGATWALGAGLAVTAALASVESSKAAAPALDYAKVKEDLIALMEADAEAKGDGSSVAGTFVRLAWHASGTYSKSSGDGGSNGATMRYSPEKDWGANAGLHIARDALEPIKEKYPGISYADLWTLAGATAIEHMGGPAIPWRSGRSDSDKPTTVPDGRLPDADKGAVGATIQHIRDIFGRMGFTDREIVALCGAHAIGRCHPNASGYWGPWTRAETTFSNEYFRLLIEEKWTLKRTHRGKKWTGPDQFEDPTGELMMLPADVALTWDKEFRAVVEEYAADEEKFHKDFATAFGKLLELGTNLGGGGSGGGIGIGGLIAKLRGLVGL